MSRRPKDLDLSNASKPLPGVNSPSFRFYSDVPSPRVGEIPPALSPLDAFAQQSRMLARRFEESQQKGRRISRLDALEVANEYGRRPTFFRNVSGGSQQAHLENDEDEVMPLPSATLNQQLSSQDRPTSHYPMIGSAVDEYKQNTQRPVAWHDPSTDAPRDTNNYYGFPLPRADSPEAYESRPVPYGQASPAVPSLTGSVDSFQSSQPRTNTDESVFGQRSATSFPRSPPRGTPRSNHTYMRSVVSRPDEDLIPPPRFAENSSVPRPRSPYTPDTRITSRSPSIMSDNSAFQEEFRRPSFNFSRPLSTSSNKEMLTFRPPLSHAPSFDSRPSCESRPSIDNAQDHNSTGRTSPSTAGSRSGFPDMRGSSLDEIGPQRPDDMTPGTGGDGSGATSYIYAKYDLPRGRVVERTSQAERASWIQQQFIWEEARIDSSQSHTQIPPILPDDVFRRPIKHVFDMQHTRSHSAEVSRQPTQRAPYHRSTPSSPSMHSYSTDSTVRGHTKNSASQEIANMTPEEHLEKGIECHSVGSLSKSTYHLRHAAKAGLPTGMLLYALACRHGWGMRGNQEEGVRWLKKAVDSSSLEIIEQHDNVAGPNVAAASKSRKAQFALAIYELGMSYMNGWRTPKGKALAVRCFEVAGNWGDSDALAEAGFCYTEGVGCKKDLKKAAALYRRAAEGGMSMSGNSWIYKQKYMDEPLATPPPVMTSLPGSANSESAVRPSRSRARSIFSRKKSFAAS